MDQLKIIDTFDTYQGPFYNKDVGGNGNFYSSPMFNDVAENGLCGLLHIGRCLSFCCKFYESLPLCVASFLE